MKKTARFASTLILLASSAACRRSSSPSPPVPVPPAATATTAFPKSQEQMATTAPVIAVRNFMGLYDLSVSLQASQPKAPPIQLVGLALARAQYFGTLADYDRALAAAEHAVVIAPKIPEAWLYRANARQSLHEFAGALADIEHAKQLGADADTVDGARVAILQALGRYDEALALRTRLNDKRATSSSLAGLAQLVAEMGDLPRAEQLFVRAQDEFGDVSPFPLAWIYFQAGLVEERAGRPSTARELYRAAHERLPQYAAAAGHLAALDALAGDNAGAVKRLEPIVAQSDDPEYMAQLGVLVGKAGDDARSKTLIAAAKKRYDELTARHPAAFADHAARFWLAAGADPARALSLAKRNLRARPVRDAYELAIDAALAAHDAKAACQFADAAVKLPYPTAALHVRAGQAFTQCGRRDRAQSELAAAVSRR